ncbi:MAG TPA: glutaredoxin domain-containing protein [Dehalococcoidia bacterium]|nr:glutaredoxin domain-containing protein [Dehalococcoidia bacterium]
MAESKQKVILYTLRGCPTSDKARAALTERGIDFEERRVNDSADWFNECLEYAVSVPVIIWGEGDVEVGWEGEHG